MTPTPRPLSAVIVCLIMIALVFGLAGPGASRAAAAPPLPASTQRYTVRGGLNPLTRTVHGHVSISLVNTTQRPLDALVFHLYLNAFRDRQSVFMRESGGRLRGDHYEGPGSIELNTLKIDGQDLLRAAERELVPGDRSQLRVRLPKSVQVGGRVQIESDFVSRLPPVFARTGYAGDFFAVAQWYPKLAKLEADGTFQSFAYHAQGEFYADFADYSLIIDTPESYVVGATGELAHELTKEGRTVRRFEARHVHDVAWVASPHLVEKVERMGAVETHVLYPGGYELAVREHVETLRKGLSHFGARFTPYPYPTLTMVVPPRGAEGAAGMEYPTLFLTAGLWFPTPGMARLSGAFVTAHELAHQWFYGLLASNELRYPVLDEGLSEWASIDLIRELYGAREALPDGWALDMFELERRGSASFAPPGQAAYAFAGHEYGASVYGRAAIALESVRRAYGHTRFDQALKAYASEQRFAHPTPEDLGRNFDVVYGRGFANSTLLPLLLDGASSNVRIVEARTGPKGKHHRTRVVARRSGAVALPTWVALYDAEQRELARTAWPSHVALLSATFDTRVPVARIVVDPDRALLVDDNAADQVVLFAGESAPSLFTRLTGALALLLSWVGP